MRRVLACALAFGLAGSAGADTVAEVFPDGIPYPFERVLERLEEIAGPENVKTALVPFGRSLQRFAAAPDYLASPRIVVAVTGDRAAGPMDVRIADRLFFGFQPAAEVLEIIAFDDGFGRFRFREVVGYGTGGALSVAERDICTACHQGGGPIFARPLWSETNANPMIAAALLVPEAGFHGVARRASVDDLAAIDASVDRAARLQLAEAVWDGCGDAVCRSDLLIAALRGLLTGAFDDGGLSGTWPEVTVISPDIANRDPLMELAGADPGNFDDAADVQNPELARAPMVIWRAQDGVAATLAEWFSEGDAAWIEARLAGSAARRAILALPCVVEARAGEQRFDCGSERSHWSGFVDGNGRGRLEAVTVQGRPVPGRLDLAATNLAGTFAVIRHGRPARLGDGRRIDALKLGADQARLVLVEDFLRLEQGLRAAVMPERFDRRAVLRLVGQVLEAADG